VVEQKQHVHRPSCKQKLVTTRKWAWCAYIKSTPPPPRSIYIYMIHTHAQEEKQKDESTAKSSKKRRNFKKLNVEISRQETSQQSYTHSAEHTEPLTHKPLCLLRLLLLLPLHLKELNLNAGDCSCFLIIFTLAARVAESHPHKPLRKVQVPFAVSSMSVAPTRCQGRAAPHHHQLQHPIM